MASETWFCGLGPKVLWDETRDFLSAAILGGVWGMTSCDFCCVVNLGLLRGLEPPLRPL